MPLLVFFTRIFQRKMQVAFEDVRNQVANMNTFVQERVTGMKIVQLFNREDIEAEKISARSMTNTAKPGSRRFYTTRYFCPIADIITSLTLGFVVLIGGIKILNGDHFYDVRRFVLVYDVYWHALQSVAPDCG